VANVATIEITGNVIFGGVTDYLTVDPQP